MISGYPKQREYETVITPNKSWGHVDWQELFHYRDLLFLLVRRDFVSRYKQTILGPAWFIIQPLITAVIFNVIFNKIAKIPTDNIPPMLFYLCGLLAWDYFAKCLNATSDSFRANAHLFEKVYFPRLIVPLSAVISNIFVFAVQLAAFLVFYLYFKYFTIAGTMIHPTPYIFLLPALLLQAAILSLGIGLWVSALTAKYRDLSFLMGFLIQLWMYLTPIFYPISTIPDKLKIILAVNPMSVVVESYRTAFFGTPALGAGYFCISYTIGILVLLSGILIFNRTERTFVDTV